MSPLRRASSRKASEKQGHDPHHQQLRSSIQKNRSKQATWWKLLTVLISVALSIFCLAVLWDYVFKNDVQEVFARQTDVFEGIFFQIPCSKDYENYKRFAGCTPTKCGRAVKDTVVNQEEAAKMLRIARRGLSLGGSDGGASILDLHSGALSMGKQFVNIYRYFGEQVKDLFDEEDFALYSDVRWRIQKVIAETFGIDSTRLHLTKPTFFSRMNNTEAKTLHDEYWHPHIDKVTYGSFDYTSLLYLSDYKIDFGGGKFVFVDDLANRTVEPRTGRVSFFTSGSENLHYVEKVVWGTRYAITRHVLLVSHSCPWIFCAYPHCYHKGIHLHILSDRRKLKESLMNVHHHKELKSHKQHQHVRTEMRKKILPSGVGERILEMGLCSIFLFYFIMCIRAYSAKVFLKLNCDESVTGIFNEDTILPCQTDATHLITLDVVKLHEEENDTLIFTLKENDTGAWGRAKLRRQDSQDLALIIEKTQPFDEGEYEFQMQTDRGHAKASISLVFKAPYTVPQIKRKDRGSKKGLLCTTFGYPKAQLYWKIENQTNLNNNVTIVQREDKLYNISSYIPLVEDWCSKSYVCSVCMGNNCISQRPACSMSEALSDQPIKKDRSNLNVFLCLGVLIFLISSAYFYSRIKIPAGELNSVNGRRPKNMLCFHAVCKYSICTTVHDFEVRQDCDRNI
ncbi:uncharacterized protein [Narcine bancroftii]|uniref:uncharacterized protein isoform X2 n=1 Tax=Narcine bancroftii TaxID=1343680 RepID=UPI003831F5EC